MLDKVRLALRIKSILFDAELSGLIAAARADLHLAGVVFLDTSTDPLIEHAIILYVKANFGFSDDSEKYQKAYDMLKCSLCLGGDYQ